MARLLLVHHSPTPTLRDLTDAVLGGTRDEAVTGVEVVERAALEASAEDVLAADGYLLVTPANFGYMSGALKHFFDTVYYVCADDTRGLPFGLYVHGNLGVEGAVRAVETVTAGLGWVQTAAHVLVTGAPGPGDLDACVELGGTLAATITPGG